MKKTVLTFLFSGTIAMTMAQTTKTVKGAVIDINGNPLPGAKVEATGGAERTVTDADGTFSLEVSQWLKSLSVTYPGMKKNKKNIKSDGRDLIFTMNEKGNYWFVNAIMQYNNVGYGDGTLGAGVMFGQLNKWGWYGKAVMDFASPGYEGSYGPTISAGVIKRVFKPFYMYLGAGYTKLYDDDDSYYDDSSSGAFLFEVGAMHRMGHFNLNYGAGVATDFIDAGVNFHLGVGYSF